MVLETTIYAHKLYYHLPGVRSIIYVLISNRKDNKSNLCSCPWREFCFNKTLHKIKQI